MKTILATAILLTLGGGAALAQAAPERGATVTKAAALERAGVRFDRRDANSDGMVDAADRAARADRAFARLDADGDGAISRAEWDSIRAKRGERRAARDERRATRADRRGGARMGRRDAAGGALTRAEAVAAAATRFERLDTDGDGTLTSVERRAARRPVR